MRYNVPLTSWQSISSLLFICVFLIIPAITNADDKQVDSDLLNQYITSKGYQGTIVFDASNIKQYWVDKSVFSKDGSINIILSSTNKERNKESVSLRLQLMNVNETQDCKIDVISKSSSLQFSVLDNKTTTVSKSSEESPFIDYSVSSALVHLEDTIGKSFSLRFSSPTEDQLKIKMIVLSFSNNPNSTFLSSPGALILSRDNVTVSHGAINNDELFSVLGKRTNVQSKKCIFVSDTPLKSSITVNNIGETPTRLYVGYALYSEEGIQIDGKNYPYNIKDCQTLNVISAEKGNKKIIVDSVPVWQENCYLALNVKDDLSDIPNFSLVKGKIREVNQISENQSEIIMSEPLSETLEKNTKVRIHGRGGAYIYTGSKLLQPGESSVFNSTIQKDDSFLQYSSKAFSRGVYYVIPILLSYSVDATKDNTILIENYSIEY